MNDPRNWNALSTEGQTAFAPWRARIHVTTRPFGIRIDGGERLAAGEAQRRLLREGRPVPAQA